MSIFVGRLCVRWQGDKRTHTPSYIFSNLTGQNCVKLLSRSQPLHGCPTVQGVKLLKSNSQKIDDWTSTRQAKGTTRLLLQQVYYSSKGVAPEGRRAEAIDKCGPLAAYRQLLESGKLKGGDQKQEEAAQSLQRLYQDLAASNGARTSFGLLKRATIALLYIGRKAFSSKIIRGVYLHGGVGTGKTMLMDVFFQEATVEKKWRVHFHSFMLDMHSRLHDLARRRSPEVPAVFRNGRDPVSEVAVALAKEATLLCLDEVEVTDIADALIMLRLFSELWSQGVVLVATSNSAPEDLYRNGLNRHLFVPFFGLLRQHCEVLNLDAGTDYRRGGTFLRRLYLHPLDQHVSKAMDDAFAFLTGGEKVQPVAVRVMMGRTLRVPRAARRSASFTFWDLCGAPLGAADYLAVAKEFDALFISGIPCLGDPGRENEARRFVTLIDILYESNVLLFCSAETALELLFADDSASFVASTASAEGDGSQKTALTLENDVKKLSVAGEGGSSGRSTTMFGGMEWSATGRAGVSLAQMAGHGSFTKVASKRTLSRLLEMQSEAYVKKQTAIGQRAMQWLQA